MSFLKKFIRIHPLTLPIFALLAFTPFKKEYFILYLFIFLHEISHLIVALLLGEKCACIHLLPWGCMLSLTSVPLKFRSIAVFSAGSVFNFIMYFLNIFPAENLTLAVFNLIPVLPLDGGVIVNALFPCIYFPTAVLSIAITAAFSLVRHKSLAMPLLLTAVLSVSEKHKIEKNINSRILRHFSVEKASEKLYNTIDKL